MTSLPKNRKTGGNLWSQSEDDMLARLVGQRKSWEDISKQFPGRTRDSCRMHYRDYIEPGIAADELAREYQVMSEMFVKHSGDKNVLEPITQDELRTKPLKKIKKLLHGLEGNLRKLLCDCLNIELDTQRSVYLLEEMIK